MALNDYTGTVLSVEETIFPSSTNTYYLQDVPDSVSSIIAYAITDIHNKSNGEDITIEDEYSLSISDSTDTFIEVTTEGKISDSTLKIRHKEGTTGTWSSPYTPTNPQMINGVSYSFSNGTYSLGANWEFKIWKLEPVTYSPVSNTQLYVNLTNGQCQTTSDDDYNRIAIRYNSLGSIIRVETLTRLYGNTVSAIPTNTPSSYVIITAGTILLGNNKLTTANESLLDLRQYVTFVGQTSKYAYITIYYDSNNNLFVTQGEEVDVGVDTTIPAFPVSSSPIAVVKVTTDSAGSLVGITKDDIFNVKISTYPIFSHGNPTMQETYFYTDTLPHGTPVYVCADGYIAKASNLTEELSKCIGVTDGEVTGNNKTYVVGNGAISGLSGLIPGQVYYLGEDGVIQRTPPTTGARVEIGVAIDDSSLFVRPSLISQFSSIQNLFTAGNLYNNSATTTTCKYTVSSNSWAYSTTFPQNIMKTSVLRSVISCHTFGGDEGTSTTATIINKHYELYNGTWASKTNLSKKLWGTHKFSLFNKLFINGGKDDSGNVSKSSYSYLPSGFTSQIDTPSPAIYLGGSASLVGYGYSFYGKDSTGAILVNRKYTSASDTWTQMSSPPSPEKSNFGSTEYNNYAYVIYRLTCLEYDSSSDTWISRTGKPSPSLDENRCGEGNNGLYNIAGKDSSSGIVSKETKRYDYSDTWISRADSPTELIKHDATGVYF